MLNNCIEGKGFKENIGVIDIKDNVFIGSNSTIQEAMRCFTSQLHDFPHPRSLKAIEALAQLRGSTVGVTCAEAFSLVRQRL